MAFHTIRLPAWISAGMIFQQGLPLSLYGYAQQDNRVKLDVVKDPTDGRKVSKLDSDYGIIWSHETVADEEGRFTFELPPYKPSTDAYTLIFSIPGETISIKDLRCGDVWLMLGSVPLSVPISSAGAPRTPLKDSALQLIRFFVSPRNGLTDLNEYLPEPVCDLKKSSWISAKAGGALAFVSSTAFSLAYHLADQLHYPVGIVDLSVAGSSIYSWLSRDTIEADPDIMSILKDHHVYIGLDRWKKKLEMRDQEQQVPLIKIVPEMVREAKNVDSHADEETDETAFASVSQPSVTDAALNTSLNAVSRDPFVHQEEIRSDDLSQPRVSAHLSAAREAAISNPIPANLDIKKKRDGEHIIQEEPYEDPIDDIPGAERITALYNHKIYPLRNMNIRGIVFAPDVRDVSLIEVYDQLMRSFLSDLSRLFGPKRYTNKHSIPSMILLQLRPDLPKGKNPYSIVHFNETLCSVRRKFPMKIGIIGQHDMLLPDRAMSFYLGRRISFVALGLHFTPKMPTSCPECIGVEIVGSKILLSFDNTNDGLKLSENESILRGFSICGQDRVYRPAQAKILHGVRVMVWHDDITEPQGVTYGYNPIPQDATFKSRADLPVLPFRFDRKASLYCPDLSFTYCDRLTTVALTDKDGEFSLVPVFEIRKGTGHLFQESLNKTEGSGAIRIEYVPRDNEFVFGPILSYPSILAPLNLSAFRRIQLDVFNPDLQTKSIRISGFSDSAIVSSGLKWQTVELVFEEDQPMIIDHLDITLVDGQPKGAVYIDNIRFLP
jgi:hypothetical protein